jgi:hypothetical protein
MRRAQLMRFFVLLALIGTVLVQADFIDPK